MLKLLKKEILLSMHPTAPVSLILSALVLVPNYPYAVVFFYTTLAVFFTCLLGRENNDVAYSLTLPIAKKDIVTGRFAFAVTLQLLQILLVVPCMILSRKTNPAGNLVGMDANIVLLAEAFLLYGIFNLIFFTRYYKNVAKVGTSFVAATSVFFLMSAVLEVCTHTVPFVRDRLDTPDPLYASVKTAVLAGSCILYGLLTAAAYKKSAAEFDGQDI
ncbi:ABC-2 transporter permease [Treponema brennaborense]|uniref:ABC-2 transporter permease n=1 Tax=Treponema brennaborense (strain DSM 12168 / CIP 105900 / DD5/3) TaxID=906968 RepID=F4LLZ2_TREBD|nr:ABC-2 transporter permease [Treponema brennaborense]AEE15684.1 hypothetical protein Trebr_0234 [Treponema brennaborense DSM 12168]